MKKRIRNQLQAITTERLVAMKDISSLVEKYSPKPKFNREKGQFVSVNIHADLAKLTFRKVKSEYNRGLIKL